MKKYNVQGYTAFIFENRSLRQSLLKNTFWIFLSDGFGKALRAILFIYLARVLGPNEYGILNFAMAFVALFVSFLDFGLSSIITRELASDDKTENNFPALLVLKFLLMIGTVLMIWVGSFLITPDFGIQKVIRILAIFSALGQFPEFFYAFWRAKQRMEFEAWANIGNVSLMTIATFLVIFNWPSAEMISYGYLFCSFVTLITVSFFFYSNFLPLNFSFETAVWKKFLWMSYPLALTSILGMLYSYVDSILMGYHGQITQNGWYNAASKIIYVIMTPASIISVSFFPLLSLFNRESPTKLQKAVNQQLGIMLFLAFPIVVGGILLAPKIIYFLYGAEYQASVKALQILLFMVGPNYLVVPLGSLLVAVNHQNKIFLVSIIASTSNIFLNFMLIPKFSLYGAAVISVCSYSLILISYLYLASTLTTVRILNRNLLLVFAVVTGSTLLMYFVLSLSYIQSFHVLLMVLVGAAIYFISFLSLMLFMKRFQPEIFNFHI